MSIFEYVLVLISMVLSLGLAKILESHAGLLKTEGVRRSPAYLLWLVFLLSAYIDRRVRIAAPILALAVAVFYFAQYLPDFHG